MEVSVSKDTSFYKFCFALQL